MLFFGACFSYILSNCLLVMAYRILSLIVSEMQTDLVNLH